MLELVEHVLRGWPATTRDALRVKALEWRALIAKIPGFTEMRDDTPLDAVIECFFRAS